MLYKFGSIIKEIRVNSHITQKNLAEGICSQSVLSRIENNEEIPNVVVMHQLCNRLHVSLDDVMQGFSAAGHSATYWTDLMGYHYRLRQYDELTKLLKKFPEKEYQLAEKEQQKLYFYRAQCRYEAMEPPEKVMDLLQQALECTIKLKRKYYTDMELLLFSEIGKLYIDLNETSKGLYYLQKSLSNFFKTIERGHTTELNKIFYNSASACLSQNNYEGALPIIEQGIIWARSINSYYYLDELLLLKGVLLDDRGDFEEACRCVRIAETIKEIAYGSPILGCPHQPLD